MGGTVTKVARAVTQPVRAVARCVTHVARKVAEPVRAVARCVSHVARMVTEPAKTLKKVKDFAEKTAAVATKWVNKAQSYATKALNATNDWLNKIPIIGDVKRVVEKGVNWVSKKANQAIEWAKDTPIGRTVMKAVNTVKQGAKWLEDNIPIVGPMLVVAGKAALVAAANSVAPGVTAFIRTASTVIDVVTDPKKLMGMVSSTAGAALNRAMEKIPFLKKAIDGAKKMRDKGLEIVDHYAGVVKEKISYVNDLVQDKIQAFEDLVDSKVEKAIKDGAQRLADAIKVDLDKLPLGDARDGFLRKIRIAMKKSGIDPNLVKDVTGKAIRACSVMKDAMTLKTELKSAVESGNTLLRRIQSDLSQVKRYTAQMEANCRFDVTVKVERTERRVTERKHRVCHTCQRTCDFAFIASAIVGSFRSIDSSTVSCRECPNKCRPSAHSFENSSYIRMTVDEKRIDEAMKARYDAALAKRDEYQRSVTELNAKFAAVRERIAVLTFGLRNLCKADAGIGSMVRNDDTLIGDLTASDWDPFASAVSGMKKSIFG